VRSLTHDGARGERATEANAQSAGPEAIDEWVAEHPQYIPTLQAIDSVPPPRSWATVGFNSINSFTLVDAAGEERVVRWRFEPEQGEHALPESEWETADHDYLMKGVFDVLPFRYLLRAQLAEEGDPVEDCTIPFPAERQWVDMGVIEITGPDTERERDGDILVNDPMRLIDGIEPTDDRSCTYAPTSTVGPSYAAAAVPARRSCSRSSGAPQQVVDRSTPPRHTGGVVVERRPVCAPDRRHRGHLPVRGDTELRGNAGTVERPELPDVQVEGPRLHREVRDRLPEVVQRELRVLPVGVLDVAVAQVRHQQRRRRRPPGRARGQVPHQPTVRLVAAAPHDKRPRLRVPRRRRPPRGLEEDLDLGRAHLVRGVEHGRAPAARQQRVELLDGAVHLVSIPALDRSGARTVRGVPERVAGPRSDERLRAAIARSHLRGLPGDVLAELLVGARRSTVSAGRTLHRVGDGERHVELVVNGLVRVHASAPDGRTLTVRYCRPGALIGILSLYAEPFVMPATTQVVVETDLLALVPAVLRRAADQDVRVARALLLELSERVAAFTAEIGGSAFATVRQRVARHLLDLASSAPPSGQLVAPLSQQELADAAGTVREVVVRILRELREAGVITTGRGSIRIDAPERLLAEAYPSPVHGWNAGS
jgi:CRP/FNR family transcriptional regulator, cyclic AMP receptor protein